MTAALRVFEYNARVYRRTWRGTLFITFLAPMLFLASMGFGLGRFVDQGQSATSALGGIPYAMFLAPALLATQAMQTAGFESTYPVMGRIVWDKIYHGMLATPIGVDGIVFGQLAWIATRLTLVCGAFFLVMVAFGSVRSPIGVFAIAAAVLTGMAFAAPIVAFTATQRNDQGFNAIFRFGITPLFLFSGTFFPIEQLPLVVRPIAWLTPLWHGVELSRGLALGQIDSRAVVVHAAVPAAYVVIGILAARITFRRALVT
jgi:lipooligosaccharide transport system permease protein